MQYLAELIAAVRSNGSALLAGGAAFLLLVIIGAAVRGRAPRAGTALAVLGLGIPVAAVSGWLAWRGLAEIEMSGVPERSYDAAAFADETPPRGYIRVSGHAHYGFGMLTRYGTVLMGNFSKSTCYPVVDAPDSWTVHLVACTFGREPGGSTEEVTLAGVYGMRDVPGSWRRMFKEESRIDIAEGAMILEEGVSPPSKQRGMALVAAAGVVALAYLAILVIALRRRGLTPSEEA